MRKVGLFVLAIIMALGALGVGYAYWTQDIYADTNVTNGYVQASFTTSQTTPKFVDMVGMIGGQLTKIFMGTRQWVPRAFFTIPSLIQS